MLALDKYACTKLTLNKPDFVFIIDDFIDGAYSILGLGKKSN